MTLLPTNPMPTTATPTPDPPRGLLGRAGNVVRRLAGNLLDAALPQTCLITNQPVGPAHTPLVPQAAADLAALAATRYCRRCGRTARPETIHTRRKDHCPLCRKETFWSVAEVVRVGPYEPVLRALLVGIKYTGHERSVTLAADLLATALADRPWLSDVDALIPVPMHPLRRLQRPVDHARELALLSAQRLGLRMRRAVRRAVYRPSQVESFSRAARFANVQGCFRLRRGTNVRGQTFCVVDNILTTGATLNEVARVLRNAGAKRIYGAVVARTPPPGQVQPEPVAHESDLD